MAPVGVLVYGYDEVNADKIKVILDTILNEDTIILSASTKEDTTVDEILQKGPDRLFEEKEPKVMMMLGMEQEGVMSIVRNFPKDGSVPRPIFCTLTQHNIEWKFSYLIEYLLEEQREMMQQRG